jgi:hypothetical protein
MMGRPILRLAALLAASASLAGVAVAAGTDGPPAPDPALPERNDAATVTVVDRDQLATLGVLRRDAEPGDAIPDGARQHTEAGSGPGLGANPDLARRALRTPLGEALYVVPARGWVCLTSTAEVGSCTPTDRIADGYAVSLRPIPSGYRLSGLVPDGVARVEVRGAVLRLSTGVGENAWLLDVPFVPTSVAWTGAAGERTVPVAAPPLAPTAGPLASVEAAG